MSMPDKDTPLIRPQRCIVTLPRGTILKMGGVPIELLSDDAQFKTVTENLRFLRGHKRIDEEKDE